MSMTHGLTILLLCLLAFVAWTIALVVALTVARLRYLASGGSVRDFGVPDDRRLIWRLFRAHVNCVENLPLFASVVVPRRTRRGPPLQRPLRLLRRAARLPCRLPRRPCSARVRRTSGRSAADHDAAQRSLIFPVPLCELCRSVSSASEKGIGPRTRGEHDDRPEEDPLRAPRRVRRDRGGGE